MVTAHVAAKIGAGQRTTAVPTRRQPRTLCSRLGSNRPNPLPTAMTAGIRVSATATATSMPIAQGAPTVWKTGNRAKLRQYVRPAMVRPDARTTWATPR